MSNIVYVSANQLAQRWGVHPVTVWRWTADHKIPLPTKLSRGCTRWVLSQIEDWEASRDQGSAA